jgi:cellulose synthase (UDP-forming)
MKPIAHFSVSKQISARFDRRRTLRRAVAVVYVTCSLAYLFWRASIFNPDSIAVSSLFYAAEWIGFILGLTVIFSAWRYTHHEPGLPPPGLSVDVLIPTYKEPLNVIRRTVIAGRDIHYPHQTWVLDDANRPDVKALARSLGVHYSARGFNKDAKAGNLNHGLRLSQAEFVAVFDADHIAQPHALDVLLGLMTDARVAMVQTPQDYYNTDAFQYLNPRRQAGLWHDQSYFYSLAQSCRDSWNASSCVGTGVLYRRAALDVIGGIPTDTVTEDFHTSLRLHKHGWQTRYLNEPVAYGIAAADLGEYYKTRHRWAHGNLSVLRHERILTCSGITFKQRLSYLSLGLIYLEGWQQLFLFLTPLFALVLGWAPFNISIFNILVVLLYPILSYLLLQEFGCGFSRFWTNEIFAMARWPVHIASAAALLGKKLPWRSSTKNIQGLISWRLMTPQLSVFTLSALALMYAFWRLNQNFVVGPLAKTVLALFSGHLAAYDAMFEALPAGYSVELVAIAGFWAAFNMARALGFAFKTVYNARRSHTFFRFGLPLPVSCDSGMTPAGQTVAISEDWVRISFLPHSMLSEHVNSLTLHLPDGPLHCAVDVSRREASCLEGYFIWDNKAHQDRLASTLYSIGWQRELQHHHAYFLTPSDVIGRLFGLHPFGVEPKRHWDAGLLQHPGTPQDNELFLVTCSTKNADTVEIVSFVQLPIEAACPAAVTGALEKTGLLTIKAELPISSLPHPGLNGKQFFRYLATFGTNRA